MSSLEAKLTQILQGYVSKILAKSILTLSVSWAQVKLDNMGPEDRERLLRQITKGLKVYQKDPEKHRLCVDEVSTLLSGTAPDREPEPTQLVTPVSDESGIVTARSLGRDMCKKLGFSSALQIKVATGISELARNIVQYAQKGTISIKGISSPRKGIEIIAADEGPGIRDLETILAGEYQSKKGMGIGLMGTKKMMDDFEIETNPGQGTVVTVRKYLS